MTHATKISTVTIKCMLMTDSHVQHCSNLQLPGILKRYYITFPVTLYNTLECESILVQVKFSETIIARGLRSKEECYIFALCHAHLVA